MDQSPDFAVLLILRGRCQREVRGIYFWCFTLEGVARVRKLVGSPLKKGTGSEVTGENQAKNTGREVPVPLFQRAVRASRGFV